MLAFVIFAHLGNVDLGNKFHIQPRPFHGPSTVRLTRESITQTSHFQIIKLLWYNH